MGRRVLMPENAEDAALFVQFVVIEGRKRYVRKRQRL
jgi:hypothetical protein